MFTMWKEQQAMKAKIGELVGKQPRYGRTAEQVMKIIKYAEWKKGDVSSSE